MNLECLVKLYIVNPFKEDAFKLFMLFTKSCYLTEIIMVITLFEIVNRWYYQEVNETVSSLVSFRTILFLQTGL